METQQIEYYKIMQLEDLQNEIWIDMIEFDGIYQVSNLGRIKGVERWTETRPGIGFIQKEKIKKQVVDKKGSSIKCGLAKQGKLYTKPTSRLVFFSFNYNIEDLPEHYVMHKDGNYKNNTLENLKIGSKSEIESLKFIQNKSDHLKLVNHNLSKHKIEKGVFENGILKRLECRLCNQTMDISLFRAGRNECKKCSNTANIKNRIIRFNKTIFKTTDIESNTQTIYNDLNREDLLKMISIATIFKYCKSGEVCCPSNRVKINFAPFKIEILKNEGLLNPVKI